LHIGLFARVNFLTDCANKKKILIKIVLFRLKALK